MATDLITMMCNQCELNGDRRCYYTLIPDINIEDIVPPEATVYIRYSSLTTNPFPQATLGIPAECRCPSYRVTDRHPYLEYRLTSQ